MTEESASYLVSLAARHCQGRIDRLQARGHLQAARKALTRRDYDHAADEACRSLSLSVGPQHPDSLTAVALVEEEGHRDDVRRAVQMLGGLVLLSLMTLAVAWGLS